MEKSLLRLECLKLARAGTHLGPSEVIANAELYENYCLADVPPVSISGNSIPLPKVIEPDAGGKDHKPYSKK